jgi:hypothetical protein
MDFNTNHECGLLIEGHEYRPQILENWHHAYYARLLEGYGLEKAMDLLKWQILTAEHHRVLPVIYELAERLEPEHGITVRTMRKRDFAAEDGALSRGLQRRLEAKLGLRAAHGLRDPPPRERAQADPRRALGVGRGEGRRDGWRRPHPPRLQQGPRGDPHRAPPPARVRALRAQRRLDEIRVFALGVKPDYRHTGVAAYLYRENWERSLGTAIVRAETGWILETNKPMNRAMQALGGDLIKRYRVYRKSL